MEHPMGLKTFDPEKPYGLIYGAPSEGRYMQDGITFGADGLPLNPELATTDDVIDPPTNPESSTTDDVIDPPPPERRKKS